MKSILVVGAGSIGQRHIRALINLGETNIAIFRSGRSKNDLPDDIRKKSIIFYNLKKAFLWKPTHVIISNPTSIHVDFIEEVVKRGIQYFVEKPIADNLQDILALKKELDSESFNNGMVGYQLRFNDLFSFIKKIVREKRYGNIITASLRVGQYLPNWHPYEDYRNAYFSRKDLGGGVLRTLSHEIDLVQFLFGKIKSVYAKVGKVSNLEIDVDDTTDIIAKAVNCEQLRIHLNYLDPKIIRKGEIYFSEGKITYDAILGKLQLISNIDGKSKTIFKSDNDYNKQYENQMNAFINNTNDEICCSIDEGIQVLKVIEECEISSKTGKEICLD